jgi:hypothetical protein
VKEDVSSKTSVPLDMLNKLQIDNDCSNLYIGEVSLLFFIPLRLVSVTIRSCADAISPDQVLRCPSDLIALRTMISISTSIPAVHILMSR